MLYCCHVAFNVLHSPADTRIGAGKMADAHCSLVVLWNFHPEVSPVRIGISARHLFMDNIIICSIQLSINTIVCNDCN